jgi:hypothetical protein
LESAVLIFPTRSIAVGITVGWEAGAGHPPACASAVDSLREPTALRCSFAEPAEETRFAPSSLRSDSLGESDNEARAARVRLRALRCSTPPTHAGGRPAPASQAAGRSEQKKSHATGSRGPATDHGFAFATQARHSVSRRRIATDPDPARIDEQFTQLPETSVLTDGAPLS